MRGYVKTITLHLNNILVSRYSVRYLNAVTDINNEADLFKTLEKYRPGDTVKVVVQRIIGDTGASERVVLNVKLGGSDGTVRR